MDKMNIIEFFDHHAETWDAEMIKDDAIIGLILDNAGVSKGKKVLDVACGTGVLIPEYIDREAASVTGIDISAEMIKIARSKFNAGSVHFICGDVEEMSGEEKYDCIVIYNAFPHFPEPQRVLDKLSAMLEKGGTLTVAHGMSREKIDQHHAGTASKVSRGLMSADELAEMFSKNLRVTTKISDERMYQLVGIKE